MGWAMLNYGSNKCESKGKVVHLKACLGNYQCPHLGCNFTERPKVPQGSTNKQSPPQPCNTLCPRHGLQLIHTPCNATLKIVSDVSGGSVDMFHTGIHEHLKPHPIRATLVAMESLKSVVRIAPELNPKKLLVGTNTRDSMSILHPAFNNLSRLAHHRRNILAETKSRCTIGMLAAFEERMEIKILASSNFSADQGHISLVTPFQSDRIKELSSSMQTDTIEGFLVDPDCPNANVTMTSAYDIVVDRTIPLVISILFGKKKENYQPHFAVIFKKMELPTDVREWESSFPGNTCDFSLAEKAGFQAACRQHCPNNKEEDFVWEKLYHCCSVHFKRTLNRIVKNQSLIAPEHKTTFKADVLALLLEMDLAEFNSRFDSLVLRFPKVKKWLRWNRDNGGKFIFPAMQDPEAKGATAIMSSDTNAQERIGGDFQQSAPYNKLNVGGALDHIYRYMERIRCDWELASQGLQLRYHLLRRKSKKCINDGRAPDTNEALAGRPVCATKQPTLVSLPRDFGIKWGFRHNNFIAKNTCALDTVLMSLFLLSKFSRFFEALNNVLLRECFGLIEQGDSAKARYNWCIQVHGNEPNANISTFFSLESQVTPPRACPELFAFKVTDNWLDCDSQFCPNPMCQYNTDGKRFDSIPAPVGCLQFTQNVLEFWLQSVPAKRCSESASSAHMANKPTIAFRKEHVVGVEFNNVVSGETYLCNGMMPGKERVFLTLPPLLHVLSTRMRGNDGKLTEPMITKPDRTIRLENNNYTLSVVVYLINSGTHFSCHVFLGNRILYYDGMKTPVLKWVSLTEYNASEQLISSMWYMKERSVADAMPVIPLPDIRPKLDTSSDSSGASSDSERDTEFKGGKKAQKHMQKDKIHPLKVKRSSPILLQP